MKFKINADILNKTAKCKEDLSCLSGKKNCLCDVEDSFDNKILFIKPIHNSICDYKMTYGRSYVCMCPTRKEIHKLYKK